jgi:hypothetical protein
MITPGAEQDMIILVQRRIRDVSFGEDLSQIRTGHGPANMATLRNFAVSRHRLNGTTKIAHACRQTARHPNRALDLLT